MSLGEIYNVNIVAKACTVLGRIVISEDAQALALADCSLGDERNEIVRNTARKFTDESRRMSSDRIEITKGYTLDLAVLSCSRSYNVAKDIVF